MQSKTTRLIRGMLRHLRRGTLLTALRKLGPTSPAARAPNRFSAQTRDEAAEVLTELSFQACQESSRAVLLVVTDDAFASDVESRLHRKGAEVRRIAPAEISRLTLTDVNGLGCIALATLDSREQFRAARELLRTAATAAIPLEYIALPREEYSDILRWDRLTDGDFISPLHVEFGDELVRIFGESLQRFGHKTEVRDFLDICQLLRSIEARQVAGNVAEFGSFRGHSGYLMSRVLERLDSSRTLFMFDMFENFPDEGVGVDRFWSGTHKVDFEAIQRKFSDRSNVQLIKGDFTKTLPQTETGPLAFAFVDCDSYRATRFLLDYLWRERLVDGGIVAMEDYGHAALLGNRLAVHEFFDGRRDAYTFFSQYSGFFIALKLPSKST